MDSRRCSETAQDGIIAGPHLEFGLEALHGLGEHLLLAHSEVGWRALVRHLVVASLSVKCGRKGAASKMHTVECSIRE